MNDMLRTDLRVKKVIKKKKERKKKHQTYQHAYH